METTTDETAAEDARTEEAAPQEAATGDGTARDAATGGASGADAEADADVDATTDAEAAGPSGVGQGAGAVVSVALGIVSLTGSWTGTVAAARETLVGQLRTSSTASVSQQIKEVYGDAWHTTALWAGLFALVALVTGAVVLVRPAFGAPGRPQAPWIKSVAWAGVALGVIGLLLAVLKYSDALLGLPPAS
ncbi:hypothetical protein ACWEVY_11400 [Streptomyces longwoodensis]